MTKSKLGNLWHLCPEVFIAGCIQHYFDRSLVSWLQEELLPHVMKWLIAQNHFKTTVVDLRT